jgi:hypothetical protein
VQNPGSIAGAGCEVSIIRAAQTCNRNAAARLFHFPSVLHKMPWLSGVGVAARPALQHFAAPPAQAGM